MTDAAIRVADAQEHVDHIKRVAQRFRADCNLGPALEIERGPLRVWEGRLEEAKRIAALSRG